MAIGDNLLTTGRLGFGDVSDAFKDIDVLENDLSWTSFTPSPFTTILGEPTASITGIVVFQAEYMQMANTVWYRLVFSGTVNNPGPGTNPVAIGYALPVTAASQSNFTTNATGWILNTTAKMVFSTFTSTTRGQMNPSDIAALNLGPYFGSVLGCYEAA